MSTSYPNKLDNFNNPSSTDLQNKPLVSHSSQHQNVNDAIEAIEIELGLSPHSPYGTVRERLDVIDKKTAFAVNVADGAPGAVNGNIAFGVDETIDRRNGYEPGSGVSPGVVSGTMWATIWCPKFSFTVNYIQNITTTNTAGATPTLCRLGIYERVGSTLTLVSSIPNETTLWASALTNYKRQLSTPLTVYPNKLYYIGMLIVTGTTRPSFYGVYPTTQANIYPLTPVNSFTLAGQTDLPSTFNLSDTVTNTAGGLMYYYLSNT